MGRRVRNGARTRAGSRRRFRAARLAASALALAAGLAVAPVPVAAPAVADEGLAESTHGRYVLDADEDRVVATVTTTVRNTRAPSGGYVYYYDRYGIPVPAGAQDVRAVSGGVDLPVSVRTTEDPGTATAAVTFAALHHGRSRTIEWSFTVPGEPVRSADPTRVGPGYATFAVQAVGDPGRTSVEVVVPSRMTFDATGDAFTASRDGATTTYTADGATGPHGTWAVVSARDPEQADERQVTVGDTTLTLRSFPGDDQWSSFVAAQVAEGLPALEDAVGRPWPGGLETIREDVSPQALGYAWFDPGADEIVVPEDLDAALLYHELSHAWLHPDALRGRWLYEGLAETVAHRVLDRTGGQGTAPRRAPDRDAGAALPLTSWTEAEPDTEAEDYAYAASYTAVHRMVRDLDDEAFSGLVAAALAGESAYAAPGDDGRTRERTDWQRFLDLAEARGVDGGAATYRRWVVDADQRAALEKRADSRAVYTELDAADGDWHPPRGLRTAMADWRFARAHEVVADLGDAPAQAAAVQEAARAAGIDAPAAVREAYTGARSGAAYADLATLLPQAADAVAATGAALRAADEDRDPVSRLGAGVLRLESTADEAVARLDAGDLDEASALAGAVQDRSGWTTPAGAGAVLLALGVLVGLGAGARRAGRRRERRARLAA